MKKNKKKIIILTLVIIFVVAIFLLIYNYIPQTNSRDESKKQIQVIADYINIRKSNNTNSKPIGKVYKNEIYNVIDNNKSWIKIKTNKGLTGWIISYYKDDVYIKYLEVNGKIPEEQSKLNLISNPEDENKEFTYDGVEWNCAISLDKIKEFSSATSNTGRYFITKDNDLYEFTKDKLYSNNSKCKKVDTNYKFNKFIFIDYHSNLLKDTSNNIYSIDNNKKIYKFEPNPPNLILMQKYPISYTDEGETYYVDGKNLYLVKLNDNVDTSQKELVGTFPNDEDVIDVYGNVFKTSKAYYRLKTVNKTECEKYEDVKCKNGLAKVEQISADYDKVEYYNGKYLILKDDLKNIHSYYEY